MQKNAKLFKTIALIIELSVLIAMFVTLYIHSRNSFSYVVSMDELGTNYEEMTYNEDSWSIDAADGESHVGDAYLLYGPGISLTRGTYTIELDYSTSQIQKAVVEADEGVVKTADFFLLSNNKNELSYDFILETNVQGFKFRIKEFMGGDFTLNGMTIRRNNHDIRSLIFVTLCIFFIIDLLMFIPKVRSKYKALSLLLGVAFIASLPLFPTGMMTGSDIIYHLVRIDGIADGLKNGVFPVKMYSIYNDSYGYPVGVFYGDVMLYIPAVLRLVGFTTMTSYKIYIFIVNLITLSISYICGKKMFLSPCKGLLFSIVYTFSTYRLVCVYARAAVGEYTAASFYPIIMLAIWNIYTQDINTKEYKKNAITLAEGMACLIYTHVLSTEMFVLVLGIFALALFKKTFRRETILIYVKAVGVCALLCMAFIVPFLEYYLFVDLNINHSFDKSYIQNFGCYISDYFVFFKSITGGNYITRRGILTPGLVLMVGFVLGIVLILLKKADKKIIVATSGSAISLFVASNLFPWDLIGDVPFIGSFLASIQFPYRYLEIATCFLSILLILSLDKIVESNIIYKRVYIYATVASLMMTFVFASDYQDEAYITSILRSYDTADLARYTRAGDFGMVLGTEYLMVGTDMNKNTLDYSVYGEKSKTAILGENGIELVTYVDAKENATVEIPRFAYPHFVARDNKGNKLMIEKGFNNRIKILFPSAYKGEVYVDFEEPWYWRMAELISLISVIGLILKMFLNKRELTVSQCTTVHLGE